MAEYKIAVPLKISGLLPSPQLAASIKSISKRYINNLVDLKNLDPQCASESGKELVKVIWYYRVEALEPAEIVFQNMVDTAEIFANMEELDIHLQDIWNAYNARTVRELDKYPNYISCKCSMELLLCVILESQKMANLDQLKPFISASLDKRELLSFTDYPKDPNDSGSPTVLFVSESPQKDGISFITGASQFKLKGYPQLEQVMNDTRASRFTKGEVSDISLKIKRNRAAVRLRVHNRDASPLTMNTEFEKLASSEEVKNDLIKQRKVLHENANIKMELIRGSLNSFDEATCKNKIAEIEDIGHDAKKEQYSLEKRIKNAERGVKNATLELEGASRKIARELASPDDYWDHSEERGTAFISNGLREVNPCWSCYSLYRFNQKLDSSGIRWTTQDNEHGRGVGLCAEAVVHVQSQRQISMRSKECEE